MKKVLLFVLLVAGVDMTAHAQKFTQPNPVHEPEKTRKPVLFQEKSAQLATSLRSNDIKTSQTLMTEVMTMMMYRGDELVAAKAPKAESDSKFELGRRMKAMLSDVSAQKDNILKLVSEMQKAY